MTDTTRGIVVRRRLRTVSVVVLMFVLVTLLLPLLAVVALTGDIVRWVVRRRPFMLIRAVAFLWVYLSAEMFGLTALTLSWLVTGFGAGKRALMRHAYWIQATFLGYVFRALRLIFRLGLEVEGSEVAASAPAIYMFRHASMIDTLLPSNLVTVPHRITMRYVLKDELLLDPCFDICGNRIPNYFVNRSASRSGAEIAAVGKLAEDLGDQGLLIYPEGTRYSRDLHKKAVTRLERRDPDIAELSRGFRHVLPPRLGGPLAVLDAGVDVVFCTHAGLGGFARVKDLFGGEVVGATVRAKFWRVPAAEIPADRDERVRWLFEQWQAVDDWIAAVPGT